MKKFYMGLAVMGLLALGAVVYVGLNANTESFLEDFVEGRETREIVTDMESTPFGDLPIMAFAFPTYFEIRYFELNDGVLTHEGNTVTLYDDYFYASIAPYINFTHDCTFHAFPGCQSELESQEMYVRLTDSSGDVVFEGMRETYQNGFMGFWLPRHEDYTIEFELNGYMGTFEFSTNDDSPTCLTEFRLINPDTSE